MQYSLNCYFWANLGATKNCAFVPWSRNYSRKGTEIVWNFFLCRGLSFSISSLLLVVVVISVSHIHSFLLRVSWMPHSLRLWLGWLQTSLSFWQGFAINENDAWSFLSTSEGRPCGHWGLFSSATGIDEKSPLRLPHGCSLHDTLLTHVHAPALSLTGCDDKMMTYALCISLQLIQIS